MGGDPMIYYELILTILLALSLAYVLRVIWLELRPPPGLTWDESVFDIENYVNGGLDNLNIEGLEERDPS